MASYRLGRKVRNVTNVGIASSYLIDLHFACSLGILK